MNLRCGGKSGRWFVTAAHSGAVMRFAARRGTGKRKNVAFVAGLEAISLVSLRLLRSELDNFSLGGRGNTTLATRRVDQSCN